MSAQHTVILLQFRANEPMTRTYLDFDTISLAMEGLLQVYEQHVRRQGQIPTDQPLHYKLEDLVLYLDGIADLSCMVYNDVQKVYLPHGLDWIKSQLYMRLKKNATKVEPQPETQVPDVADDAMEEGEEEQSMPAE